MRKEEIKKIVGDKLIRLMGEWFEGRPLYQALGITVVQTNINKFDSLMDMLTDEEGNVKIDLLVENLGEYVEKDYTIDLTTISPYLPKRTIILSKDDIKEIIGEVLK